MVRSSGMGGMSSSPTNGRFRIDRSRKGLGGGIKQRRAPDKKVRSSRWLADNRQCYPFSFRTGRRRHCRLRRQLAPRPARALATFAVTDLTRLGRWRKKFARLANCDPIRRQLRIEWSDDARVLSLRVLATCVDGCSEIQHVVLSAVMVIAG